VISIQPSPGSTPAGMAAFEGSNLHADRKSGALSRPWLAVGLMALGALAGCGGGKSEQAAQPAAPLGEKAHVLQILRAHYLWNDNIRSIWWCAGL